MTRLSPIQTDILEAAYRANDGRALAPPNCGKAVAGLIKRGFLSAEPLRDGVSRLSITPAGREAVAHSTGDDGAEGEGADVTPNMKAPAGTATAAEPKGKIAHLLDLLRRKDGATIEAMMVATGWQAHSVRGALSGAIKKNLGIAVTSVKADGVRTYKVEADA